MASVGMSVAWIIALCIALKTARGGETPSGAIGRFWHNRGTLVAAAGALATITWCPLFDLQARSASRGGTDAPPLALRL